MRILSLKAIGICSVTFPACGLFDSGSDQIAGDYYLTWIDTYGHRYIHKKDGEGVVSSTVFAVGHNKQFIFAKQLPRYGKRNKIPVDSISYFIITRTDYFVQDKPVYGPLQQKAFDSLCRELKINRLHFDIHYSKN